MPDNPYKYSAKQKSSQMYTQFEKANRKLVQAHRKNPGKYPGVPTHNRPSQQEVDDYAAMYRQQKADLRAFKGAENAPNEKLDYIPHVAPKIAKNPQLIKHIFPNRSIVEVEKDKDENIFQRVIKVTEKYHQCTAPACSGVYTVKRTTRRSVISVKAEDGSLTHVCLMKPAVQPKQLTRDERLDLMEKRWEKETPEGRAKRHRLLLRALYNTTGNDISLTIKRQGEWTPEDVEITWIRTNYPSVKFEDYVAQCRKEDRAGITKMVDQGVSNAKYRMLGGMPLSDIEQETTDLGMSVYNANTNTLR